jgi:hypothetical protein
MLSKIKFYVLGLLSGVILAGGIGYANDAYYKLSKMNCDIKVNGESVKIDLPILNYNDRAYLPLREVSRLVGSEISWDSTYGTIGLTYAPKPEPQRFTFAVEREKDGSVFEKVIDNEKKSIVFEKVTHKDNKVVFTENPNNKGKKLTCTLNGANGNFGFIDGARMIKGVTFLNNAIYVHALDDEQTGYVYEILNNEILRYKYENGQKTSFTRGKLTP